MKIIFFTSLIQVEIREPYQISNGNLFRRATSDEIKIIDDILNQFGTLTPDFFRKDIETANGNGLMLVSDLPQSQWKYYVIESNCEDVSIEHLSLAFWLSSKKLRCDIGIEYFKGGGIKTIFPLTIPNLHTDTLFYTDTVLSIDNKKNSVNEDYLREVSDLFKLIENLDKKTYQFIVRALKEFNFLKAIHSGISIRELAYFIIWESLLAHKPDPKDPTDSITRQLKNKIPLINNRLALGEKISIDEYLENCALDKAIKILYDFRSDIIHGNEVNFLEQKKILKNRENVERILFEITRKLILFALRDPLLIQDLRNC